MEKKKELSIIVPIYNVENYLEECLDSLYELDIYKEIILVNDASPDTCQKIIESYQQKYPEITKVMKLEKNGGLSHARNSGFSEAEGEYVFFMDSDDSLNPREFEKIFEKRKDFDVEIDILHGNGFIYEDGDSKTLSTHKIHSRKYLGEGALLSGKEFLYTTYESKLNQEVVWLNIYRKDFLLANKRYFESRFSYEDTLFSLPTFWKAKTIVSLDIPFYYYRKRKGSITSAERKYMDYLYVYHKLLSFILEENVQNSAITSYFVARIRSFAQKEKVFQEEIYRQLLSLPKKNIRSYRHLFDLTLRKAFCQKISYQELMKVGKRV